MVFGSGHAAVIVGSVGIVVDGSLGGGDLTGYPNVGVLVGARYCSTLYAAGGALTYTTCSTTSRRGGGALAVCTDASTHGVCVVCDPASAVVVDRICDSVFAFGGGPPGAIQSGAAIVSTVCDSVFAVGGWHGAAHDDRNDDRRHAEASPPPVDWASASVSGTRINIGGTVVSSAPASSHMADVDIGRIVLYRKDSQQLVSQANMTT